MAADAIVYCLENLTDYIQFERLCHDLMIVEGYTGLEPIGGFKDKGRDAIHIDRLSSNQVTIFAYSVREDWYTKLKEDAEKIQKHGHECHNIAFLCTAFFSPTERDNAISFIKETYGWNFIIYGLERLRSILSTNARLLANHPQIFSPPFFPVAGGLSLSFSPEYIIIDYSSPDEVLATWLARKLKLHGYLVWCRSIDPITGESVNNTTESLVKQRAFFYVTVLSDEGITDPDLTYRRNIAFQEIRSHNSPFVIPILSTDIQDSKFDSNLRDIEKIDFAKEGYQKGLDHLIQRLEASNCPVLEDGKRCALNSFFPSPLTSNEEESVLSNVFPVLQIPKTISRYTAPEKIGYTEIETHFTKWAFRKVDSTTFLSFHSPPDDLKETFRLKEAGGAAWDDLDKIDGISTHDLTKELIKKSINVACEIRGLQLCSKSGKYYFPDQLLNKNRLKVTRPDYKTSISAVGERKYYKPIQSEKYRYHLSPDFYVMRKSRSEFWIVLRIYLRITDENGQLLEGRKINSRRKHLCRDWWNNEWLGRILAIMQYLGNGNDIVVGTIKEKSIVVGVDPLTWVMPLSICEEELTEDNYNRDYLDFYQIEDFEDEGT